MQPHKQMAPKDRQAQAHGGHKAWKSLDLERQTLTQSIEACKQT